MPIRPHTRGSLGSSYSSRLNSRGMVQGLYWRPSNCRLRNPCSMSYPKYKYIFVNFRFFFFARKFRVFESDLISLNTFWADVRSSSSRRANFAVIFWFRSPYTYQDGSVKNKNVKMVIYRCTCADLTSENIKIKSIAQTWNLTRPHRCQKRPFSY